jgi:twitching motility protein PilT
VPRIGGGLILAAEVLIATDAVRSLIAEGRIKQIATILQSSRAEGMLSLDQSLAELVRSGEVLIDQAITYANDPANFRAMAKS